MALNKKTQTNLSLARGNGTNKGTKDVDFQNLLARAPEVPEHLNDQESACWSMLVAQLIEDRLLAATDLSAVENLAIRMANLHDAQQMLKREGDVISTDKGTPIINPRRIVVRQELRDVELLQKQLGITVRSRLEIESIRLKNARLRKTDEMSIDAEHTQYLGQF
jgi:P27 family predicted phage terminase small subunit